MVGASARRVLILGLDGGVWTVLDAMRERGFMPNLDALLKQSASGTLRSTIPPVTSCAWTTMMTGCSPGRHGVFDHRYYDAAAGRMKVNHSLRVRVPTFWHLLSDTGHSVASLNVPVTYPPMRVNGIVVSGMDAPHLEGALSGAPKAFADRLKSELPDYSLKVFWKKAPTDINEMREAVRLTVAKFEARAKGGWLADEFVPDWSALMVQFQNLDPFQHRAWRFLNVDETGIENPEFNAAAGEVMKGLDRAIGILCELADRRGASVLVMSDHGFGCCLGRVKVNQILIESGFIKMPHPAIQSIKRLQRIPDLMRLWMEKRRDPKARSASLEGSVTAQYPFNWKKTLGFAPHQDTAAMVYLNTVGRAGANAPLKTPRQIDDARSMAYQILGAARHPDTQEPLFPMLIETGKKYDLDPSVEGYPDLIALPDERYWVRSKLGGTQPKRWVEPDPNLPGTHRLDGIVALKHAGVTPGRHLKARLEDIAPTILTLLGESIPHHIEGKPLPCLKTEPVLQSAPSHTLPSIRQDRPTQILNGPHAPAYEHSAEDQELIEQRLRELGYLE